MPVEDKFNTTETTGMMGVQTGLAIMSTSSSDSVSESDGLVETIWAGRSQILDFNGEHLGPHTNGTSGFHEIIL